MSGWKITASEEADRGLSLVQVVLQHTFLAVFDGVKLHLDLSASVVEVDSRRRKRVGRGGDAGVGQTAGGHGRSWL